MNNKNGSHSLKTLLKGNETGLHTRNNTHELHIGQVCQRNYGLGGDL